MDLVTVIVPVYNVEKYLDRCVDSITGQTYEGLEILLIDDGSTDKSGKICDHFTDRRIRVIHQENSGVSAARNRGLDNASGDWIMFVDSDDLIAPDMVEVLLHLCKDHDCLVSQCGVVRGSDGVFPAETVQEKIRKWEFHELYSSAGREYRGIVCGKLFHRSLFDELRFPEGRTLTEDEYAAFIASYRAGSTVIINRHMYYYFMSPDSASRSHKEHVSFDVVDTYEELLFFLRDKGEGRLEDLVKKELGIRIMMNYIRAVGERMPDVDTEGLMVLFRKYYPEIKLMEIPKRERYALMLFRHMPHTFAFFENHLKIIYRNKISRGRR